MPSTPNPRRYPGTSFRHGVLVVVVAAAALCSGCFTSYDPPSLPPYISGGGWIVDADQAKRRYDAGATLIDVRQWSRYEVAHAARAIYASWLDYSQPSDPQRGRLLDDRAELGKRMRETLGVDGDRDVLVVGDPVDGWGEDGRIVWMLRALGHHRAALVDGGQQALARAGVPITDERAYPQKPGDFQPTADTTFAISRDELRALLDDAERDAVLVDTREPEEFAGATPYGEARGGHVPGAVNLHYASLLSSVGTLRPRQQLLDQLASLGLTPDRPVVAYCTGGVRSGWFVAVLIDLGFANVRNYAGSMWEWSASDAAKFPLE